MNSSIMLVKSNIKKTKAQTTAIFVLIMITALLINLCLMAALDYQDEFDVLHKETNDSDVTLILAGLDSEVERFGSSYLAESAKVESYCLSPVTILDGSVPYGDYVFKSFFYAVGKSEADRASVGKYRYEQQSEGSGVYLPYQFYVSGNYKIGDRFVVEDNGHNLVDTTVRGFYSRAMTSSNKSRICGFILTDDIYDTVAASESLPFGSISYVMASIRLTGDTDCSLFEYEAISDITKEYTRMKLLESNNKDLVKSTDYATQIIAVAVLAVAGLIFALVSIVLVSSNIAFFINTNMKTFGMLKAIGYRSRKLRGIILAEFAAVGLLATACGTALSYAVFPSFNTLTESMTSILFPVHFMPKPVLIAFFVIMILVLLTAWTATGNIKKLPPISAIRSVSFGNRREHNVAPVESSVLPINLHLAVKTMLGNWKQNLIVFITLLGISLGSVFCILMYQNVVMDQEPIIQLSNQIAHAYITVDNDDNDALRDMLSKDDRVTSFYLYNEASKVMVNDTVLLSIVIDDGTKINNNVLVYSGALPSNDGEIGVGLLFAKRNGLKLGDTLSVKLGDKSADYTITSFVQIVRNSGNDIIFHADGYRKISEEATCDYLVTLSDYDDLQNFNNDVIKAIPGAHVEDYKKFVVGTTADFIQLMRFIIFGVVVICVSLIAFVLYILVKTLLFKKQKEYSILKSIGYPTKALVAQTAISFLPVVILTLCIGLPLASATMNDIFAFFLRGLGVYRTSFEFSHLWVLLTGVFVVLLSFAFVCLFSLKIRKYSPRQLLAGN